MSDNAAEMEIYNLADEFISVANRLLEEEGRDLGRISSAFRYAAARFSAHEASCRSGDLAQDREKAHAWYADQFSRMVGENLDQHIRVQAG